MGVKWPEPSGEGHLGGWRELLIPKEQDVVLHQGCLKCSNGLLVEVVSKVDPRHQGTKGPRHRLHHQTVDVGN